MKIKAIKTTSPELSVDIEVENTHTYQLENGAVSHNTVSQLVNSASGIHPRFSRYYIRRVRADIKDPLTQFMRDRDFPNEQDVINASNLVFSFPVKTPENAPVVSDLGAMHQLKLWKIYQDHWCEHKPSITVYYTDNEFMEIGGWIWNNFDAVSGISFLPHSDHNYRQAPYEEITREEYEQLLAKMPTNIDWEELALYESDDNTSSSQTLACVGNVCEFSPADLVSANVDTELHKQQ